MSYQFVYRGSRLDTVTDIVRLWCAKHGCRVEIRARSRAEAGFRISGPADEVRAATRRFPEWLGRAA